MGSRAGRLGPQLEELFGSLWTLEKVDPHRRKWVVEVGFEVYNLTPLPIVLWFLTVSLTILPP